MNRRAQNCYSPVMARVFALMATVFVCLSSAAFSAPLKIDVTLQGIESGSLRKEIRKSLTVSTGTSDYTSLAPLRRAADRDAQKLRQILVAKGFYAAEVVPRITRDELSVALIYQITAGPKFDITGYEIKYVDEQSTERPQIFADIGQTPTHDPDGATLQALDTSLLTYLRNNGYPSAQTLGWHVKARFADHTATAVFPIKTGPRATYGDIVISGTEKTTDNFLRAYRNFDEGDIVSAAKLSGYQDKISGTALFTEVSVSPGTPDDTGRAPIIIDVTERKRRTIGAGISYSTDVGPGVTAFWENRNFRGHGETLEASFDISAPTQEFVLSYDKPLPRLPGSLTAETILENEDTDAYNAQTLTLGGGITQNLSAHHLKLSAKAQYTISKIIDNDGTEETFSSSRFPLAAVYNTENDTLNPTQGHKARLSVTPFLGSTSFVQTQLGGSSRISFGANDKLLLAGRALFGASYGLEDNVVPATERFYAGGGGSVRGYGYQLAGPLDDDGNPTGGASLAEINLEARYRPVTDWQAAIFVDAGSVFDDATPSFTGDIPLGAGLGIRYFTPIGPVRLDIATPLNPREITTTVDGELVTTYEDDPLQVYIALGQPF